MARTSQTVHRAPAGRRATVVKGDYRWSPYSCGGYYGPRAYYSGYSYRPDAWGGRGYGYGGWRGYGYRAGWGGWRRW